MTLTALQARAVDRALTACVLVDLNAALTTPAAADVDVDAAEQDRYTPTRWESLRDDAELALLEAFARATAHDGDHRPAAYAGTIAIARLAVLQAKALLRSAPAGPFDAAELLLGRGEMACHG